MPKAKKKKTTPKPQDGSSSKPQDEGSQKQQGQQQKKPKKKKATAKTRRHRHTLRECLTAIGIDVDAPLLAEAEGLDEEFRIIKKAYRTKVLETHPDKGGDPAQFRDVQASFEVLRDLYSREKIDSFFVLFEQRRGRREDQESDEEYVDERGDTGYEEEEEEEGGTPYWADAYDDIWEHFANMPTPSWEFFYEAADEDVPLYYVELARSDRSKCKAYGKKLGKCNDDGPNIPRASIRVGSLDEFAGSYARWHHLRCWRVPNRVWKGLPNSDACQDRDIFERALLAMNDVVLAGFQDLERVDRDEFIDHVMDKTNYARDVRPRKGSKPYQDFTGAMKLEAAASSAAAAAAPSTVTSSSPSSSPPVSSSSSDAIVPSSVASSSKAMLVKKQKQAFVMPVPGRNGVLRDLLQRKTVVLTGVFPEVGGGAGTSMVRFFEMAETIWCANVRRILYNSVLTTSLVSSTCKYLPSGLNLGKAKVRSMVESFGGRVTSAISGKTDILLVGKEPGYSKVSEARRRGLPMVSLHDMKRGLEGNCVGKVAKETHLLVPKFSSGYRGNSKALLAAPEDVAFAALGSRIQQQQQQQQEDPDVDDEPPKKKPKKSKKKSAAKPKPPPPGSAADDDGGDDNNAAVVPLLPPSSSSSAATGSAAPKRKRRK